MDSEALQRQLVEMRSMGFDDDAMSERALTRAGWDVEAAVELLFQGAISDSEEMEVKTEGMDVSSGEGNPEETAKAPQVRFCRKFLAHVTVAARRDPHLS